MIHITEIHFSGDKRTWCANTRADVMRIADDDASKQGVSIWYMITGQQILDQYEPEPNDELHRLVEEYGTNNMYTWDWEEETFTHKYISPWDATLSWMEQDLIRLEVKEE